MRRSRARIGLVTVGISAAVACCATATAMTQQRLAVSPASGHPRTTFTVHFTAPARSGTNGSQTHGYHLSASPATRRSGCINSVSISPIATADREQMAVRLDPAKLGGRWCAERYSGAVTETTQPTCGPPVMAAPSRSGIVCPQYIALTTIGQFGFRVRH